MIEAAPMSSKAARKVKREPRASNSDRGQAACARIAKNRVDEELAKAKEELLEKVSEDILLGIAGRAVSTALCSARCLPPLLGARCLPPFLYRLFGIGSSGIGVGIGIGSSA